MFNKRKAIIIVDEDTSWTLIKPSSQEFSKKLIVVREDAYGDISMKLESIENLRKTSQLSSEEFDEMLSQL